MAKTKRIGSEEHGYGWSVLCPACDMEHVFFENIWTFENNDVDNPTFRASMLSKSGHYLHPDRNTCWCTWDKDHPNDPAPFSCILCHSFVTNGKIEYLNDCSHELRGQTIELPNIY